ncbi:capsular polysaccharide transport system ATP-binding protein [Litoreibacter meonggei]|uniref:Capsular polysaccharide transport system ATP-binding protein n=1 Tax=Litoreibacter meonggei TaxID=1049199 RepID=A0A497X463_9RHOB|nr:ATP-binding cassette domain-containing protein [Litoreibacter meonggei]RLJ59544.1 capsular polysaccharide transport system ATP-binding protein [Litoreibacter meonggei]
MITLENVSLLKPGFRKRETILQDANTVFESGERVGILAAPGTGKSSLARLFAGIDKPDRGAVRQIGRVSWPIGFAGFLHPNLTVPENINNFARLVGIAPDAVIAFCRDVFGLEYGPKKMMHDLSPTQRALLAYACALSVEGPATWIADETITIGEPGDRKVCDEVLAERLKIGGLVFLSRNARQLTKYCDRFLVLINQQLVPCNDLAVAQEALNLSKLTPQELEMRCGHV